MCKEVKTEEVLKFMAADGKFVRIRWLHTGETEIHYVKVLNPGLYELRETPEKGWDCPRIYPEDIGKIIELLEVVNTPA